LYSNWQISLRKPSRKKRRVITIQNVIFLHAQRWAMLFLPGNLYLLCYSSNLISVYTCIKIRNQNICFILFENWVIRAFF
jgi:hypothetical protein